MAKKKQMKNTAKAGDNDVLFGILTYLLFIVGLVWYVVDENIRKSAFAKYHFKQSIILVIAAIILSIAASIMPVLRGVIVSLVNLAMLVLVIFGIINVANKEQKELPIIGQFARNLKF